MSEATRPFADVGRQQHLFPLQPSDPTQIGPFRCINRLKPGEEPVNADKPTPILASLPGPRFDGPPDLVVVKVLLDPPTSDGAKRLSEERVWSEQQERFRGSGSDGRFQWAARDFFQGVSLDQLVVQPDWNAARATTLARLILTEVAGVHRSREIHCDIKPANVIVNGRVVTLIDFESSRDRGELDPRAIEATKSFASPEQLMPRTDRPIDARTDLFSWGVTVCHLYEPGYHPYCDGPFEEALLVELDRRSRGGQSPSPRLELITEPGLQSAVRTSLAWEPAGRASADDLLRAIGAAGSNTAVLDGATEVLKASAAMATIEPVGLLEYYFGPRGLLGRPTMPLVAWIGYAGAGLLTGFLAAFVCILLVGMMIA